MKFSLTKAKEEKLAKSHDLSYRIIKDKHGMAIFRKTIYSRVIFNFLLIALQIAVFTFFVVRFQSKLEIYFGASIALSTGFIIYLSNSKGKNEFKITWLLPTIIFPLFGVSAYILYHTNWGGHQIKKELKLVKAKTESCLPAKEPAEKILDEFPEIKGLGTYLLNRGNYYPHKNTSVRYFSSGEDFYPDLLAACQRAEKFIFIEFFILEVDETWAQLLEILEEKANAGLDIRVLYDGLGSPMASDGHYQKYLNKKGIKAHPFLPLVPLFSTQQNNRDHRKIVIIDGQVAYTGGVNISNEYMNVGKNRFSYWKDNAIRFEGPAIQNFMVMFLQTWNVGIKSDDKFESYINYPYPKKAYPGLMIPYGDDAFNEADIAEDIYLYIINNAKNYVYITSPYMVIDNQMQEALIFAANRGVNVSVIVPSQPDHFITFCVGRTFLKTLSDNGINVYSYEKGFIHEKTFISDDKVATVGSVNLDYRSLFYHFECGALMYDMPVIFDIKKDFVESLKDCKKMDATEYKKIPSYKRLIGRVLRIISPLI